MAHSSVLNADSDVFLTLKVLKEWANLAQVKTSLEDMENMGAILGKHRLKFIPIEYAEALLINTSKWMDHHINRNDFASSTNLCTALIFIISDFASKWSNSSSPSFESSYSSHDCYEVSLYIVLGLVETSQLVRRFLNSVGSDTAELLMKSLAITIATDTAYSTQVLLTSFAQPQPMSLRNTKCRKWL